MLKLFLLLALCSCINADEEKEFYGATVPPLPPVDVLLSPPIVFQLPKPEFAPAPQETFTQTHQFAPKPQFPPHEFINKPVLPPKPMFAPPPVSIVKPEFFATKPVVSHENVKPQFFAPKPVVSHENVKPEFFLPKPVFSPSPVFTPKPVVFAPAFYPQPFFAPKPVYGAPEFQKPVKVVEGKQEFTFVDSYAVPKYSKKVSEGVEKFKVITSLGGTRIEKKPFVFEAPKVGVVYAPPKPVYGVPV